MNNADKKCDFCDYKQTCFHALTTIYPGESSVTYSGTTPSSSGLLGHPDPGVFKYPLDEAIPNTAVNLDGGKLRLDLVPWLAVEMVADVMTVGCEKYGVVNWQKGMKVSRHFASTLRHLLAWWRGEDEDEETGLHHLAHAASRLMMLLACEKNTDDREEIRRG